MRTVRSAITLTWSYSYSARSSNIRSRVYMYIETLYIERKLYIYLYIVCTTPICWFSYSWVMTVKSLLDVLDAHLDPLVLKVQPKLTSRCSMSVMLSIIGWVSSTKAILLTIMTMQGRNPFDWICACRDWSMVHALMCTPVKGYMCRCMSRKESSDEESLWKSWKNVQTPRSKEVRLMTHGQLSQAARWWAIERGCTFLP